MICPKCGHPNSDRAVECRKCFYKFRGLDLSHLDPGRRDPWALSGVLRNIARNSANPTKAMIIYIGLLLIFLAGVVPVIVMQVLQHQAQ
ncbi:hypothetical protein Tfer_2823 [Thermincola ferriacetica]|uniref:Uncharacterized protein n=1 Tax=Thermincola ferriacetica TaxID=281456 RepID=A0A0L6VZS5_9FIRM|nr:hypothetical protein [Thermincola ferriacetica]KNZ68648.1 hypothetical protein Tfer_2823 [Thermincola ferriacetica]